MCMTASDPSLQEFDAGGNRKLPPIGTFLKQTIQNHFKSIGTPATVKYVSSIPHSLHLSRTAYPLMSSQLCRSLPITAVSRCPECFTNCPLTHDCPALCTGTLIQVTSFAVYPPTLPTPSTAFFLLKTPSMVPWPDTPASLWACATTAWYFCRLI